MDCIAEAADGGEAPQVEGREARDDLHRSLTARALPTAHRAEDWHLEAVSLNAEEQALRSEALGWIHKQATRIKARYPAMSLEDLFALGRLEAAEQLRRFDAPRGTFQQYAMKAYAA